MLVGTQFDTFDTVVVVIIVDVIIVVSDAEFSPDEHATIPDTKSPTHKCRILPRYQMSSDTVLAVAKFRERIIGLHRRTDLRTHRR